MRRQLWLILAVVSLALTGCSGIPGGEADAGDADSAETDGSGLASEAVDDQDVAGPDIEPEVEPLFTAHHPDVLNPTGERFTMRGAGSAPDGSITLVGDHVDFTARHKTARVVVAADTDTFEIVDLPSDAPVAEANDVVYTATGQLMVAGRQRADGRVLPTIWTATDDTFVAEVLPTGGDPGWVHSLSDDGTAVVGRVKTADETIDALWVQTGAGWEIVDIKPPPGAENVDIRAVTSVGSGRDLVAVGYGWTPGEATAVTGFWDVDRTTATATYRVPPGFEPDLVLNGVTATADGSLVVVGGTSPVPAEPVVARIDGYEPGGDQPWSVSPAAIDTGYRFSGDGVSLAAVEGTEDRLVAWTATAFTRQAIESTDGGRSWSQLSDLSAMGRTGVAVSGGALTTDGVVMGDSHHLYRWTGSRWIRFTGDWAVTNEAEIARRRIITTDDGFQVAAMVTRPESGAEVEQLHVWTSTDGVEWLETPVRAGGGRSHLEVTWTEEQTWIFTTGTSFSDDPFDVWSFDGEQWTSTRHEPIDGALRSLPRIANNTLDGGALVVTYDFNEQWFKLVPKVVAADGSVSTGDFGVAVAQTASSDVSCLTRVDDTFVAMLEAPSQPDVLMTSTDGLVWEIASDETGLDSLSGCFVIDGELIVAVDDGEDEQLTVLGQDGTPGSTLALPDGADVARFDELDGVRIALGWTTIDAIDQAGIWWEAPDGWQELAGADTGLGPDDLGSSSWLTSIRFTDDQVIAIGGDDLGVVVWTADRERFEEEIGLHSAQNDDA